MELHWILSIVLVSCYIHFSEQGNQYKRVCYFTNWAKYRQGSAKFSTDDIDPFLCTHLIFAFGGFDNQGNLHATDAWGDRKDFEAFRMLKLQNRALRTLLAIGGWTFGSTKFSNMAGNSRVRKTFVSSAVSFLRANGFDGLDIDWEYPAARGGSPADRRNFVTLCKELKDAFITEGQQSGREALLLTAAVPASRQTAASGYDIPALNNYLDFFNLMTYDFHGGWAKQVGQNSPLHSSPIDIGEDVYLNVHETARWWHASGVPKHKLVIGLATYGRSFTLTTRSYDLGAPAVKGPAGPYTREDGFWAYYEICLAIDSDLNGGRHRGKVFYDTDQQVPFFVQDNFWVGYENERSIKTKARWIKENRYGGFMVWSLALDDFNMMCPYTQERYPLIHAAMEELGSGTYTPSSKARRPPGIVTHPEAGPFQRPLTPRQATQRPVTQRPVTHRPHVINPLNPFKPFTKKRYWPITQSPGGYRPVTQRPGGYRTVTQRPGGYRPLTQRPGGYRPVTQRPGGYRPVTQRPGGYRPVTRRPGAYRPPIRTQHYGGYRPRTRRPDVYQPVTDALPGVPAVPDIPDIPFVPAIEGQVSFCPETGHHYFPDETNCFKYIECFEGQEHSRDCPAGLHWDPSQNSCNWPEKVNCTLSAL